MNCYHLQVILFFIFALTFSYLVKCEFYTAIAEMEKLYHTEAEIAKTLERYVKKEEERLEKVKWFSKQYSKLYNMATSDVETFLSNPVNGYLLLKHLTKDWERTNKLFRHSGKKAVKNITSRVRFPDKDDLAGAATALIRLQEMYLLDTSAIANGEVEGAPKTTELTAGDCFELGLNAYKLGVIFHAIPWFEEALSRIGKERVDTADKIETLEYLAHSYFLNSNFTAAIKQTEEILAMDPVNAKAVRNIPIYEAYLVEAEANKTANENIEKKTATENSEKEKVTKKLPPEENISDEKIGTDEFFSYINLCRGELLKTPKERSKLKCHYTTNNNAYFLLQPMKVEVLNLNPLVAMYYDIIHDNEMEIIKSKAMPKLKRATINNAVNGTLEVASFRISKSTWLHDDDHSIVPNIERRIRDITGLDTKYAESLHVINYGIGGYYEPHFDYAKVGDKIRFMTEKGNRLATWIFYLSDVAAGGSTVFPQIGVEVKPIKGAAAFWYNLYRNGLGNKKTRHAACPVITGSKWVANKWLHEYGNEFSRPCTLNSLE